MAFSPRRVPLALLTSTLLLAGACSGEEVPEALPLADDAPATASDLDSSDLDTGVESDRDEPGIESATAELTPEQQGLLEDCANGLAEATADADPASATYSDDVAAAILAPGSTVMSTCAVLFDPSSGIEQSVVISFMLEALPPELLLAVSALIPADDSSLIPPGVDLDAVVGGGETDDEAEPTLDSSVESDVVTLD